MCLMFSLKFCYKLRKEMGLYRVFSNECNTELGFKIDIFQSRIVIFGFLSLTTLIRFDTYYFYRFNQENCI